MISSLITDRTQADVAYLNAQREKILNEGWAALSEAEQMEYLAGLKGSYNATDLNRVTHAMEYLVERLRSYGYAVKYDKVKVPHQPQKGKSKLPEGYVELEHIESSGTQYIDTNYKPNNNTRVVIKAKLLSKPTANATLFGARNGTTWQYWFYYQAGNAFNYRYGAGSTNNLVDVGVTDDNTFDINKNVVTVNNLTVTAATTTFAATCNAFIFAVNNNNVMANPASMRLYSCLIYDNSTLVREYIPCRNPSGEVGLYDVVTAEFYGNSGTGVFIAGADIIPRQLPQGYTQVTYIATNGTQYIDTNFKPNQDTRVVMKVRSFPTKPTASMFAFGCRTSISSTDRYAFCVTGGGGYRTDYYNNVYSFASTVNYNDTFVIDKNKNITTLNNEASVTSDYGSFEGVYNLALFAMNTANTISVYATIECCSCEIYHNGSLIRDYVPCINSDGTAGLYDLVNGVFYENAGSGAFAAGSIIEAPPVEEPYDDYVWYMSDIPQAKELNVYLENARQLRNALALLPNTPIVADDMENFTFSEANNLEIILINIETTINLMIASFIYSGEIFSGEVI